jgi:hypothetical protein
LKLAEASLELNRKVGVGSLTTEPGAGPPSILTFTGGALTVQVTFAGAPVFPARSVATTSNVCCALLSLLVAAKGDEQAMGAFESKWHSYVTPDSSAAKLKEGRGSVDS